MELNAAIERIVDSLGFELVSLERGGGRGRPLLRLRIDRPDAAPGRSSITVDHCALVSRAVDEWLAGEEADFMLEVSSPGVERPLVRSRDYERFAGQRVRLRGYGPLTERGRDLEGVLVGRTGEEGAQVALEVEGERIEVPLTSIARARLVHRWEESGVGDER